MNRRGQLTPGPCLGPWDGIVWGQQQGITYYIPYNSLILAKHLIEF